MSEDYPPEEHWNELYAAGNPPWDLDGPPPALMALIRSLPSTPQRVLVPCAGYAHDAIAWASSGHDTVAIDIAPLAISGARQRAAARDVRLRIHKADLFRLPDSYQAAFDIVWEQTCLAAIQPAQRGGYFRAMAATLKDGGRFYGLLWNHGRKGGPPFDLHLDMIRPHLEPLFEVETWVPVRESVPSRPNEYLLTLVKKAPEKPEE